MSKRRRGGGFWAWLFGTDRPAPTVLRPRSPAPRSPLAPPRPRSSAPPAAAAGGLSAADTARMERGVFSLREAVERGLIETSGSKARRGRRR
jgi:hypothetical protein